MARCGSKTSPHHGAGLGDQFSLSPLNLETTGWTHTVSAAHDGVVNATRSCRIGALSPTVHRRDYGDRSPSPPHHQGPRVDQATWGGEESGENRVHAARSPHREVCRCHVSTT